MDSSPNLICLFLDRPTHFVLVAVLKSIYLPHDYLVKYYFGMGRDIKNNKNSTYLKLIERLVIFQQLPLCVKKWLSIDKNVILKRKYDGLCL